MRKTDVSNSVFEVVAAFRGKAMVLQINVENLFCSKIRFLLSRPDSYLFKRLWLI